MGFFGWMGKQYEATKADISQHVNSAIAQADKDVHAVEQGATSMWHATVQAVDSAEKKAEQKLVETQDFAKAEAKKAEQKLVEARDFVETEAKKAEKKLIAARDAVVTEAKKRLAREIIDSERSMVVADIVRAAWRGRSLLKGFVATTILKKVARTLKKMNSLFIPTKLVEYPCVPCLGGDSKAVRAARINKRNELIDKAKTSGDPKAVARANQLKSDMKAVELARLSDNAYFPYNKKSGHLSKPPEPWKALDPDDPTDQVTLQKKGIVLGMLKAAKAVIYTLPDDFPMDPKTVLAFCGTDPSDPQDILTDHDQALGLKTDQYTAAMELGKEVSRGFPGAEVTGHSLGGGKAQAAGIYGGLKGMMFNSAGLNPKTLSKTVQDLDEYQDQFQQYRAGGGPDKLGGDPLTGLQNSLEAQKQAVQAVKDVREQLKQDAWASQQLGIDPIADRLPKKIQYLAEQLSDRIQNITVEQANENFKESGGRWMIPPAVGKVSQLTSKNEDGSDASANPLAQHDIANLTNGFECRKFNNVSALLKSTGTKGHAKDYFGMTNLKVDY